MNHKVRRVSDIFGGGHGITFYSGYGDNSRKQEPG